MNERPVPPSKAEGTGCPEKHVLCIPLEPSLQNTSKLSNHSKRPRDLSNDRQQPLPRNATATMKKNVCTHRDVPSGFLLRILDNPIINHHRVPLRSIRRNPLIPTQTLTKLGVGIIHEQNLILDAVDLAPSAHHERIVGGDDDNSVDALVFDAGQVLDVAR